MSNPHTVILTDAYAERNEWRARAIKYEQALREILTHNHRWTMDDYQSDPRDEAYMDAIEAVACAALDKPGGILQTPDVQCIPRPE